ncbi:putative Forkhead box K1 protein [Naja naja]|nr:putative Forkhead box K1 protein [Naja naja]
MTPQTDINAGCLKCSHMTCRALSNPLQVLAAQASSSSPVVIGQTREAGVKGPDELLREPDIKRPRIEDPRVVAALQTGVITSTVPSGQSAGE